MHKTQYIEFTMLDEVMPEESIEIPSELIKDYQILNEKVEKIITKINKRKKSIQK